MIDLERKIELAKHALKFGNNVVYLEKEENEYIDKCLDILLKTGNGYFDLDDEGKEIFILFSNIQRIKDGDIQRSVFRYDSCKNAFMSVEGKYIWMSSVKDFNDPFEGTLHADYENEGEYAGIIKENHKRNVEAAGVFCCSKENNDIKMWSHYADKHKGVCLEYDILKDSKTFDFVNSPEYINSPLLRVDLYQALNDQKSSLMQGSLLTKSDLWENEKEQRLIKLESAGKKIEINPDCLKSVIFGLKCEKEKKEELIKKMREKGYNKNTEIKKAVKAENTYKLNIENIGVLSDPLEELTR